MWLKRLVVGICWEICSIFPRKKKIHLESQEHADGFKGVSASVYIVTQEDL